MAIARRLIAMFLCLIFPLAAVAGDASYKIVYDGGSIADVKANTDVRILIESDKVTILKDKKTLAVIPSSSIAEISYGQDVHRRVGTAIGVAVFTLGIGAMLLLVKSKKHFVGITWDDAGKKGGIAFQADKNDYRGILAGLEGVTGKKAVDSDAMTVKN